jgi:hypothetical protein
MTKNYISLDNGVPSHDTIRRVFMRLDPKALQSAFIDWIQVVNEQVRAWFEIARQEHYKNINVSAFEQVSGDHGRIEQRQCIMVDSQSIEGLNDWPGIQSVICIHSQREVKNQVQSETRYYLSSLAVNAERACQVVSAH